MRLLSVVLLLITIAFTSTAQSETSAIQPCEQFRVAGPIGRVLFEGETRRVVLFDLKTYDANFLLPEPKTQYTDVLRPGNWIVVVGCRCKDQEVYALWLKRGRNFSNSDKHFTNPSCPTKP